MTFAQLQAFALVARHGSIKAAAAKLGVSEPAVSEAVAALRRDLGDELVTRTGRGVRLTPGGRRLAAAAVEIIGVAEQARRGVREASGERALLRVAAEAAVAEHAAGTLLDAFTRRTQSVEVELQVEPPEAFADLLVDRLADVTLGPRPPREAMGGLEAVPFLRYRLVVVAAPGHRLEGPGRALPAAALAGETWLTGPTGDEEPLRELLDPHRVVASDIRAFPSDAAALAAVASGRGVMLAVAHTVLDPLRRGELVRLDIRSTPVERLWHATVLSQERSSPTAAAFRRFVTTPEATQAMLARPGGVPAGRFRPPVYVTLWDA
jgi:LysR family transcriptional regulator, low CO2-responsive transcriptional regulator